MPIFGLPEQKKPKNISESMGLGSQGGMIVPSGNAHMQSLTDGAPMGGLAEIALGKRQEQMNDQFDQPGRANFFNRKKKKEYNGITNETGGY